MSKRDDCEICDIWDIVNTCSVTNLVLPANASIYDGLTSAALNTKMLAAESIPKLPTLSYHYHYRYVYIGATHSFGAINRTENDFSYSTLLAPATVARVDRPGMKYNTYLNYFSDDLWNALYRFDRFKCEFSHDVRW